MPNISIDKLATEITSAIKEYTEDVERAIEQKIDQTAVRLKSDVVRNAPRDTGDYAKGFINTKRNNGGNVQRVIWNKKHSGLVHLLEFGHAKVGGGRVPGKPHLRPAYDLHAARLTDEIKQIIRNGGAK